MAAWGPWPSHWARVSARTSGCWGTRSDPLLVRTQGEGNVSSYTKIQYFSNDSASDVILESNLPLCYLRLNTVILHLATWKPVYKTNKPTTNPTNQQKFMINTDWPHSPPAPPSGRTGALQGQEIKLHETYFTSILCVCVQNTAGVQTPGWAASWRTQGERFSWE